MIRFLKVSVLWSAILYWGCIAISGLAISAEQEYVTRLTRVAQLPTEKPRIIISTDGDVEDQSVFLHYLMYANEFETLGIIVGNSRWHPDGNGGRQWIEDTIKIYETVRPKLSIHMTGWPEARQLLGVVKTGNMSSMGLNGVGEGKDTPGSAHIAQQLLMNDDRMVWVLAWGGTDDLAQALYRIKQSKPDQLPRVIAKLRIFATSLQDVDNADNVDNPKESGWWILRNFPGTFMILSYQFMAINQQHGPHPLSNHQLFSSQWLDNNVKLKHGPLGARYPQDKFCEGDAISFLYFVNSRLGNPNKPEQGGWGGRYRHENLGIGAPNLFVDAADDEDSWMPVWRWIPAIANDFAARMDYAVSDFKSANHRPIARLEPFLPDHIQGGDEITLDAGKSSDPDGQKLSFKYWIYEDGTTTVQPLAITGASSSRASFTIPNEPGKILSIILEVTDDGLPPLKDYIRIVLPIE